MEEKEGQTWSGGCDGMWYEEGEGECSLMGFEPQYENNIYQKNHAGTTIVYVIVYLFEHFSNFGKLVVVCICSVLYKYKISIIIKYCAMIILLPTQIKSELNIIYWDFALSFFTVKKWTAELKYGCMTLFNDESSRQPIMATTTNNIEIVH